MGCERQRSPSKETTVSHPKYIVPVGSCAADQAIVLTPVSRAVNTRSGGIPSVPSRQSGAAPAAKAEADPKATQRTAQPAVERAKGKVRRRRSNSRGPPRAVMPYSYAK